MSPYFKAAIASVALAVFIGIVGAMLILAGEGRFF